MSPRQEHTLPAELFTPLLLPLLLFPHPQIVLLVLPLVLLLLFWLLLFWSHPQEHSSPQLYKAISESSFSKKI